MKRLLLIIGLLFIILFNSSVGNTVEPFAENSNTTIVLLGDSMLKNNSYVKPGFAVDDLLRKKVESNKTIVNYAHEDAQIVDIYEQLTHVDDSDTNRIFLSVGGNNIIKNPSSEVNSIFEKYKNLIDAIKTKLPNSKLFLLNIYHINYSKLNPTIDLWNQLLNNYFYNNSVSGIVDVKSVVSQPTDLTFKIEPSESGGEKIAVKIRELL